MGKYEENKRRYERHSRYNINDGKHYSEEELELIMDYSHSAVWLARKLKRSLKAIENTRHRLKKKGVDDNGEET